jgi:hypothetical protein
MGVPMKFMIVCINVAYLVVGFKILAMERTFDCNFYCFYDTHQCERPSNDKGKHLAIVYYNYLLYVVFLSRLEHGLEYAYVFGAFRFLLMIMGFLFQSVYGSM